MTLQLSGSKAVESAQFAPNIGWDKTRVLTRRRQSSMFRVEDVWRLRAYLSVRSIICGSSPLWHRPQDQRVTFSYSPAEGEEVRAM